MKTKELKQKHLKRIYDLMVKMKIKVNEKNYLLRFFQLPQLNYKYPRHKAFQYKRNNFINKKIVSKIELLEKCFDY